MVIKTTYLLKRLTDALGCANPADSGDGSDNGNKSKSADPDDDAEVADYKVSPQQAIQLSGHDGVQHDAMGIYWRQFECPSSAE